MNRRVKQHWLYGMIVMLVWCTSPCAAGVSGSVEGKITDAADRRPVVGVNILIVGTTIDAVSDAGGMYRFPNVRTGTYNLRFSAVGYKTVIMKGVRVQIDLRARLDVQMEASAVELQPVEVVAETPLI